MFNSKKIKELEGQIKINNEWWQERYDNKCKELEQAKNLQLILEKLYPLHSFIAKNYVDDGYSLNLPDDVLRYTEDILGGKVIKQEGNKCLIIEKDGSVKTGLTKQKVDNGYNYKLIRKQ